MRAPIPSAVFAAAALASMGWPGHAGAQEVRQPVTMSVDGLFGAELLLPERYNPIVVTVENRTSRTFQGEVEVQVTHWQQAPERHVVPLDLPGGATRRVRVTVHVGDNGANIVAHYRAAGRRLAEAATSPTYNRAQDGIVILSDPPRLRGVLLDLSVEDEDPYSGVQAVTLPVGVVPGDATTGDPIVPEHAVGWAPVRLLVASAPMLARVPEADRPALVDWLRSGGRLLVFPRTDADLADPFVRQLAGRITIGPGSEEAHPLVPSAAERRSLHGDARFRPEPFGGSAPIGFGRVYVASYDGSAPPFVEAHETRSLIRSIVAEPAPWVRDHLRFPFGMRTEQSLDPYGYGQIGTFDVLRRALDPNESFRPALSFVAIILLLYVFLVGPVNFAFVGKRNQPTLALLTTPLAAIACLVLMLGVGYIGKGTTMRYRSVSMLELVEGDPVGPERRYAGLFLTRPADFDLPAPSRGMVRPVTGMGGDRSAWFDHGGAAPVLRGVRGRLWETVFVREDRIGELDGPVTFVREDTVITAVRNGSGQRLRGAIVLGITGDLYAVGDIGPGEERPVRGPAAMQLSSDEMFWGDSDPRLAEVGALMQLDEDELPLFQGIVAAAGRTLRSGETAILVAGVATDPARREAEVFSQERDLRFVRVVPYVQGGSVAHRPELDIRDDMFGPADHEDTELPPLDDPLNPPPAEEAP